MKHVTGFENNSGSQRTSRAFARLQSAMLGVFATEQIRIMAVSIKVEARVPPCCFARYLRGQVFAVQISKDRASSWTVTPYRLLQRRRGARRQNAPQPFP
jgi:hypothetical protein